MFGLHSHAAGDQSVKERLLPQTRQQWRHVRRVCEGDAVHYAALQAAGLAYEVALALVGQILERY